MRRPFAFVTKQGKVVRSDVLERYAVKQDSKQLEDPFTTEDHGARKVIEPPISLAALANLLTVNTYHLRACKTKARDSAGLGIRVVPTEAGDAEQDETQKQVLEDWIADQAEGLTTSLERAQLDYESVGFGIIELTRSELTGLPKQLVHAPAETMRIHKSKNKWLQRKGTKRAWFKSIGYNRDIHRLHGNERFPGELEHAERGSEVLWWINYHPKSPVYGFPDIISSIDAIVGDVSRSDYNVAFFENFGVPAYAVFITGDFDPGEPEPLDDSEEEQNNPSGPTPLEKSIEHHFNELAQNPHSVLVLTVPTSIADDHGGSEDGGKVEVEIKPLSVDVKDAAFRMYRQDNRDEVLSAHGIDPYRLGIAEVGSLGGTTAVEASNIYKESVIEPRQQTIENLINGKIVRDIFKITNWKIELEEIDTTDAQTDLLLLTGLFAMGVVTPLDIAGHFASRFGIDLSAMDHPALKAHYIGGNPVDVAMADFDLPGDQVMASLNGMYDRMVEIAAKEHGNGHADDSVVREIKQMLESMQ